MCKQILEQPVMLLCNTFKNVLNMISKTVGSNPGVGADSEGGPAGLPLPLQTVKYWFSVITSIIWAIGACPLKKKSESIPKSHKVLDLTFSCFCMPVLPRILDILILQDKTLFCALEAGDIVCWLVNQPIAKLDLFKSPDCRWICKTYAEYCYRNSATVRRLVQSPTLQSAIFCGVHSDLRGKGIRVSPAWFYPNLICSLKKDQAGLEKCFPPGKQVKFP